MRIILFIFLVLTNVAFCGENKNESSRPKDAFFRNSQIGRGVNLGNALEAPREGEWGVRLEEGYFDLIQKAGFTSVRIPVRWSAHALNEPPYTIDQSFFDRVDWIVRQALSRNLVAIINIHHYEDLVESPKEHKDRFLSLWKQISEHYKNQPDALYFEILNEPCKKMTSEIWNEYLDAAIKEIRKTNPSRMIVVGPVNWNAISELKLLKLPPEDRNIIVTFHFYSPFRFTHQGASWVEDQGKSWLGTTWLGTEKEKQDVITDLDKASLWSKENSRPLFMGEFGAYEKAEMQSRIRWAAFVRSEAETRNISWAWWEFCAGFGVYNKNKKEWRADLLQSLIPPKQEVK